MSKRHHPYGPVFLQGTQPLGEAQQRTGKPPFDRVGRKAFDAASELGIALREDLQQRHGEAGAPRDELFHVGNRPGHQRGLFDGRGAFGAARSADSPNNSSGRTISNSTSLPSSAICEIPTLPVTTR